MIEPGRKSQIPFAEASRSYQKQSPGSMVRGGKFMCGNHRPRVLLGKAKDTAVCLRCSQL